MQVCREIAAEQGLSALNMRTVSKSCGIALGTLYNYFSDKDELLIAAIASVWQDIFHSSAPEESAALPFTEYVDRLFQRVKSKFSEYPDFFTAHSAAVAGSGRDRAKSAMQQCFGHIRNTLLSALKQDETVSPTAFSGALSENDFVELVLNLLIVMLCQNKPDCSALVEIIRRTIYLRRSEDAGNF